MFRPMCAMFSNLPTAFYGASEKKLKQKERNNSTAAEAATTAVTATAARTVATKPSSDDGDRMPALDPSTPINTTTK